MEITCIVINELLPTSKKVFFLDSFQATYWLQLKGTSLILELNFNRLIMTIAPLVNKVINSV